MVAARALMIQELWSTEGCALEGRALMQASRSRRQPQPPGQSVADSHVKDDDLARVKAFDAVPFGMSIFSPTRMRIIRSCCVEFSTNLGLIPRR